MAIRFHCPYCDRLLGIGDHKVGAVVECPACHGRVGVPSPNAPPPPPVPTLRTNAPFLSVGQLAGLGCVLILLAGLAFAIGLLVGALG